MPPGPLRKSIEDLFRTNFTPDEPAGEPTTFKGRWDKYVARFQAWTASIPATQIQFGQVINLHIYGVLYAFFGRPIFPPWFWNADPPELKADMSKEIAKAIDDLFSSPVPNEVVESIGAVVTEPILALFEKYAGKDDLDPKEMARAFHGMMISLTLTGGIASTVVEALSAGAIKGAGNMLNQVYWTLGLGFLGWQTLAPLLSAGLQPGLTRYYQRLYHPLRFGAGELRDLYALGQITQEALRNEAETLGWRSQDIDKWIQLAFRTLSQGDVFDAFHQGFMEEGEAVSRLRALGYDPKDIPLLFKLNPKEETTQAKAFSVANARNAFSEGIITEDELRKILAELKYSDKEIDIIVALEKLSKDTKDRLLSAGDIKAAWTENVLTDQEARHWLEEAGFATQQLDVLIDTWKKQIIPDYRKLNAGTIEGAYVEGILTRSQAKDKLVGVGFLAEDADLELSLVEARNPESFGKPAPVTPKKLTPGILSELVAVGLINPNQMLDRLTALGYSQEDAKLLSEAARITAIPAERLLPQRSIEDAFFGGVLTRENALTHLKALGFTEPNANVVLDTVQSQLDAIKTAKEEAQRKRLSAGTLEDLVIAGILKSDEMKARLIANGYTAIDADLLTQRAVQLATAPVRVLTQSTIERAYLVGVLTRDQAKQKLIGMDFTPEDAEQILTTVEKENPAIFHPEQIQSTRQPTIGALVTALQMQILTQEEYMAKAQELGYTPEDAQLYLAISVKAERKSTRQLSVSQITNAYGAGFMPFPIALSRIIQNGYSDSDATLILRLEKDLIQNTDVWAALMGGTLDPFEAIAQLVNMSYSDQDILDAFAGLGPSTLAEMNIDLTELGNALRATPGGQ